MYKLNTNINIDSQTSKVVLNSIVENKKIDYVKLKIKSLYLERFLRRKSLVVEFTFMSCFIPYFFTYALIVPK